MANDELYGIEQRDVALYQGVIQRERAMKQPDFDREANGQTVQAAIIVATPSGWEPGKCAFLVRDSEYQFAYEISINGYPGFGVLDKIRGRIRRAPETEDEDPTEFEFEFYRNWTNQQVLDSFPEYWRSRMRVTGGQVVVTQQKTENPDYHPDGDAPEFIFTDVTVKVGRWLIGFNEQPVEFVVAETDPETEEAAEAAANLLIDPTEYTGPIDANGFSTNNDQRVTARARRVPFLVAPVVRDLFTLVDTSQPSPIARGALAYVSRVVGLGLSVLSVEPRVYQDLGGIFTPANFAAAADLLAALEDDE